MQGDQIQIPSTLPKMMPCEMMPPWIGIDTARHNVNVMFLQDQNGTVPLHFTLYTSCWKFVSSSDVDWMHFLNSLVFKTCHQLSCITQRQALSAGSVGQVDLFNLKKVHWGEGIRLRIIPEPRSGISKPLIRTCTVIGATWKFGSKAELITVLSGLVTMIEELSQI